MSVFSHHTPFRNKSHKRKHTLFVFLQSFQRSYSLSVISKFTRPVLREQICVYTPFLTGMTFNNNNNRRCLDLLAAMATGISQRLLLCWWCPQKNRGANWLCLWDRPVFIALVATSAALNFIRKDKLGGSRLLLLAQSLCEIHCRFVYPIQNRLCLGEKCLFVVQTLIKIWISSSVFINRLCMLFLFIIYFSLQFWLLCLCLL